jgi:rhamnose utilization protein RhaD (predicted bifunctional aldolase and dehydrogenase)/NAD(P)-dependent dehydrogenase (short-subunit alcohol dehydrogenase family)
MKSLWKENKAEAIAGDPLQLRIYSSGLLGQEPDLVLHGGGNTSLKTTEKDIFGQAEDVLVVKGSGADLASIRAEDFARVKLNTLMRAIELDNLPDAMLVRLQQCALTNPQSPNPSIEAILHAIIPFKYVDHTHADAVVTITNNKNGEKLIQQIYKDQALIVPYIHPGFKLAKKIYTLTKNINWNSIKGIILLNHGIFTFADQAQASYENMIELVSAAEGYLITHGYYDVQAKKEPKKDLLTLARIRSCVSKVKNRAIFAVPDHSLETCGFASLPDIESIARKGPLTCDHIIRTKPCPVVLKNNMEKEIAEYVSWYKSYFERNRHNNQTCMNPAPKWAVWPDHGIIAFGANINEAKVILDIARHTIKAIECGEAMGEWETVTEKQMFEMEYWSFQQAKVMKKKSIPEFSGKIALITGAASGIGLACAKMLHNKGAAVVGLDLNSDIAAMFNKPDMRGIVCDITDDKSVNSAIESTVRWFGGLDILIPNAGIFTGSQKIEDLDQKIWNASMEINLSASQRLLKQCIPYLKHGIDSAVIFIASKNVPAPGPGASAYSVAKAGMTQLARVAALELGRYGIRVNVIHPNAVYDTGIWTPEILETRAFHYKCSVEEYKTNNCLKTEVTSMDVAALVCAMAGSAFAKTTGAQVPIDGGNERVV